ncbi:MAG: SsrA-binding protein SmpB [Firmicutes bacterium]|nr:SsrA-binding protein SmpB [Bacillota bacterium]
MAADKKNIKLIAQNKKAYHDYFILETFQAGIALTGTEVKSMRAGRCNLKDSFIKIENGEAIIKNMHISPYEQGNIFNHDPLADRRLLLHKYEINKLIGAVTADGHTIVPLKVYFQGSLVKVDIAIAKGKKLYDKRQDIAKKDQQREAAQAFKEKLRV